MEAQQHSLIPVVHVHPVISSNFHLQGTGPHPAASAEAAFFGRAAIGIPFLQTELVAGVELGIAARIRVCAAEPPILRTVGASVDAKAPRRIYVLVRMGTVA